MNSKTEEKSNLIDFKNERKTNKSLPGLEEIVKDENESVSRGSASTGRTSTDEVIYPSLRINTKSYKSVPATQDIFANLL